MYQAVVSPKRANDSVEIHYLLQHDYTIMFSNALRYSFLFAAAAPLTVYDGDDTGAMFARDRTAVADARLTTLAIYRRSPPLHNLLFKISSISLTSHRHLCVCRAALIHSMNTK